MIIKKIMFSYSGDAANESRPSIHYWEFKLKVWFTVINATFRRVKDWSIPHVNSIYEYYEEIMKALGWNSGMAFLLYVYRKQIHLYRQQKTGTSYSLVISPLLL